MSESSTTHQGAPRILIQDFSGRHAETPTEAYDRIVKSGMWRRQRVVVVMPAGEAIPAVVALAQWNVIFPPNQGCVRVLAQGLEVGVAYSSAIEGILAHPEFSTWEYLLTIEHDNLPPSDGVLRLLAQMEEHPEYACISGLYWTKGEGGVPQIWGDPKDVANYRPQAPEPGKVIECCGTGMGFALWRMSMFKDARLRRPWFKTLAGPGGVGTQDLYFWTDARANGYRCAVDCDVRVGHYEKERGIVW